MHEAAALLTAVTDSFQQEHVPLMVFGVFTETPSGPLDPNQCKKSVGERWTQI